jgi:hypothetical protein
MTTRTEEQKNGRIEEREE